MTLAVEYYILCTARLYTVRRMQLKHYLTLLHQYSYIRKQQERFDCEFV